LRLEKIEKYESYPAVNLAKPVIGVAATPPTSNPAGRAAGATPPPHQTPGRRETLRRRHSYGVALCPLHPAFLR